MENKVDDFEVIQRVINTTQVILPIYEASFKYKDHYLDKGNILKYCFDKNGIPKIVIGPHCKNIIIILCF